MTSALPSTCSDRYRKIGWSTRSRFFIQVTRVRSFSLKCYLQGQEEEEEYLHFEWITLFRPSSMSQSQSRHQDLPHFHPSFILIWSTGLLLSSTPGSYIAYLPFFDWSSSLFSLYDRRGFLWWENVHISHIDFWTTFSLMDPLGMRLLLAQEQEMEGRPHS